MTVRGVIPKTLMTWIVAQWHPERETVRVDTTDDERVSAAASTGSRAIAVLAAQRLPIPLTGIAGSGLEVIHAPGGSPLHRGDVISAVDGRRVFTRTDLTWHLFEQPQARYAVTVNSHPVPLTRSALGAVDVIPTNDFHVAPDALPPDNMIEGDSAGLAYTLGLLIRRNEVAMPRCRVVVTGAITYDGLVAPIGSIAMKAHAALNSQACMIIVPRYNAAAARIAIGDRVPVVAICSLNQAVEALANAPRQPDPQSSDGPCGGP